MSLDFLEYEEQFGRLWHRLVGGRASLPRFPEAAVRLEDERRRLAVLFRGLGGDHGLELVAGSASGSRHRLRLTQRLGMAEERLLRAERTAELVLLPAVLDCLPSKVLNRDLYVWLVAFLAGGKRLPPEADPLRRDVLRLREVQRLSNEGITLAGIQRILALEEEVERLRARLDQLTSEQRSTALVVWRPQPRRA